MEAIWYFGVEPVELAIVSFGALEDGIPDGKVEGLGVHDGEWY